MIYYARGLKKFSKDEKSSYESDYLIILIYTMR